MQRLGRATFKNSLQLDVLMSANIFSQSLSEIKIGTYRDIATVSRDDTMLHVLEVMVDKKLSAIPVVDKEGL